jgi:rhamnulokinase
VAGAPLAEGWAYISSGTWSLVGIERAGPLVNDDVARANFTNEGGAYGTIRFLKNVMGLWILERCRQEWEEDGRGEPYERLLSAVAAIDRSPGLMFPDDPRLLNPPKMTAAIAQQMTETGRPRPGHRPPWLGSSSTRWPCATRPCCGRSSPSPARPSGACRSSGAAAGTNT